MYGYRYFINNDIEIEVTARDFKELFYLITRCFCDLTADVNCKKITDKRNITVESHSFDMLVVDYVNELIYLFDTDRFVAYDGRFYFNENSVSAQLYGVKIDMESVKRVPKAATYHDLLIEKKTDLINLRMIIDI